MKVCRQAIMRITAQLLMLAGLMCAQTDAATPSPVPLWPGTAPGETGDLGPEMDTTSARDKLVAGRPVIRLGNVSAPTMTIYRPKKGIDTGAAVIVFPGGGYNILALDLEGTEVCEWLNSIGVTGVLVKYRIPARRGGLRQAAPLQDAQRAVSIVRHRATELGLKPDRIGVLGFSAGGHLAAAASTRYETRAYEPVDVIDKTNARPDFAVLIYPGYLTVKEEGDRLAPDLPVSANTPPTLLIQTADDSVRVENSLFYYLALKNAKAPAEMHLFNSGGHGYGLRPSDAPVTRWPALAADWMRSLGLLTRR
jgi:acetyl esterase/lipase